MQDLGFTDGKIFCEPSQEIMAFGTFTLTRNAVGNYVYAQGSSLTNQYVVNLSNAIARRLGFFEDLQENFGSQSGTGIAGSAQTRTYRPDQIGSMSAGQQLQPRTAFKTKGFRLISLDVIYNVGTLALTSINNTLVQTVFANNVAPAVTTLLASGANGLSTAVQANPYVTTIVFPTQTYFTLNDASVYFEIVPITPATSTFNLWGFDVAYEFNYN